MPTLVLRNVPEPLYRRLKESAAEHRRSMTQQAIVSLQTSLEAETARPPRPSADETLDGLDRRSGRRSGFQPLQSARMALLQTLADARWPER